MTQVLLCVCVNVAFPLSLYMCVCARMCGVYLSACIHAYTCGSLHTFNTVCVFYVQLLLIPGIQQGV